MFHIYAQRTMRTLTGTMSMGRISEDNMDVQAFVGLSMLAWAMQVIYLLAYWKMYKKYRPYRCNGGMDEVQEAV